MAFAMSLLPPLLAAAPLQTELWRVDGPVLGELGFALATAGDRNGDGVSDLAVGSPGAGKAFVLSGSDGATIFTFSEGGRLGDSAAAGADIDGDGTPDLVFGAPDMAGTPGEGFAYSGLDGSPIFSTVSYGCDPYYQYSWKFARTAAILGDTDGDGLGEVAFADITFDADVPGITTVWTPSATNPGGADMEMMIGDCDCWCPDNWGETLAAGDLTGDGVSELLVSYLHFTQIYAMPSGVLLSQRQTDSQYSTTPYRQRLAVLGDVDGDGIDDWAGGGRFGFPSLQRVHVFSGLGGPIYTFTDEGVNVSGAGDVNADGFDDFLLADPYDAAAGVNAGTVRLYSGRDGTLLDQLFGEAAGDLFGFALAGLGDVDGDGGSDYAIGAPGAGGNRGYVKVFAGEGPPAPFTYCTAKVNSQGCTPRIDWGGTPTASGADDFVVLTRDALPGKPGLFFFGTTGSVAVPFQGGTLCALPPLTRTPPVTATGLPPCDGGQAFHFSFAYQASQGLGAGDAVNGQFWMRDPDQADGTGVALTDAIQFQIGI